MKIKKHCRTIIILLVSGVILFSLGRLSVQYEIHRELDPVQVVEEINPKIPQIVINEIKDAKIIGSVNASEIRIKSGEQTAVPDEENKFEIDIQHLGYIGPKRKIVKVTIPEWANFVASKSGKYYYEIDEKSAKKLSLANRVYFKTEEEAEEAGYLRRSR